MNSVKADNEDDITVLLPCLKQRPEYLKSAVNSVLLQTSRYWRLLALIEPTTPDNNREMLRDYQRTDSRIEVVECGGQGMGAALNLGLTTAQTDFVALLLSDDEFSDDSAFVASLHGGLKLPTGNPSRINEELAEGEEDADSVPSAIHGHDLALGSGSVDGLLGADVLWRSGSFLVTAGAEYNLRTRGHAGYQYANDFQWNVAPGFYLLHKDGRLAGLQLRLAGESKGKDNLSGVTAEDTGINSLYLGPQFSWSSPELVGQFGLDLPVSIENTALQSVPSYRLRFYLSRRF